MGLQIRVRHALGERLMELPDRTLDQPIAVGRSSGADVQIPSVTVGPRHCALFVHEGHWVVQDLKAGAGGTRVNGRPLEKAKRLKVGDVIEVGAEGTEARIEVDPAGAAAGRTGYAGGGGAGHDVAAGHAPAAGPTPVGSAAGGYAAPAVGYPPQPGYAVPQPDVAVPPQYVPPQYAQPQYAQPQYGSPQYPPQPQYAAAGYGEPQSDDVAGAGADDITGFQPPAADVGYARPRKKPKSNAAAMVTLMVLATVAIGGVVAWAVWRAKTPVPVVIRKPDQVIIIKADTQPAKPPRLFDLPAGADPGAAGAPRLATGPATNAATPAGSPGPAGADPTTRPAVAAAAAGAGGTDAAGGNGSPAAGDGGGGTDVVRKPAGTGAAGGPTPPAADGGGAEAGMDMVRKPSAPPKPSGLDPETLAPAAAQSWDAMKQLADQPGKESFAVLRFEEFRKNNPGKHDADLDAFVDKKMDRLWWERVDHLFKRIEALKVDMPKLRLDLADVNDPAVKKKMLESYKAMEAELAESNKVLREQMGYGDAAPPNLGSAAELAALSQKRDKGKYEGWKKATLYQIRTNQGRLPWAAG